ncbi:MAG TPA: aldo/keto reductase [Burkholderiales bacterium]|nr:aldo/keto reductase [Burkholderiales bacterium]
MEPGRRAVLRAAALIGAGIAFRPCMAEAPLLSKKIPATGEALPVIGLGTWQTFDVGEDAAARAQLAEVLQALADAGAQVVDSSPMYGTSESVAGELVARLGLRERLFIATKVWTSGREEGLRQIEESFRRLQVERMDLMQVHNLLDAETQTRTLLALKERQKVRYVGITHYTASAFPEVERRLKAGRYDFLQINYSLGDREAENRVLPLCRDLKVAVLINRPFGQGGLFGRTRGKPLPPWAAELGIASWAQFFLKWIVSHPAVTCAIPGTAKPAHMKDNLGAARGALPDETMRKRMADYFDSV